jgi:tetratricopeptide (TPR) repeat protein
MTPASAIKRRILLPLLVVFFLMSGCSVLTSKQQSRSDEANASDTSSHTEHSPSLHQSKPEDGSPNDTTSQAKTPASPAEDAQPTAAPSLPKPPKQPDFQAIPKTTLESLLIAEFAGQRRDFDKALEQYLGEARSNRYPSVAQRALQIAQYTGDYDSAVEAANIWIESAPGSVEPHRQLAGLYISNQEFPKALAEFHKVYLLTGVSHYELLASTVSLEPKESQEELHSALKTLANENRYIHQIWTALGIIEQNLHLPEMALSSYNSALEIDPTAIMPATFKAKLLALKPDQETALGWVNQVRSLHPDHKGMKLLQGRLLLRLLRLEEARDVFADLNRNYPEDATVLLSLSLIEFDLGDDTAASHHLSELLATGKHMSEALFYSGMIARRSGDANQAFSLFSQVPAGHEFLDAHSQAAELLTERSGLQAATEYLRTLREKHPKYRIALTRIEARLLITNRQLVDAMLLYTNSLQETPNNTEILYSRAMLAGRMGKLNMLEQDLKKVINLEPDNADALNALGYTLIDGYGRLEEAQPLLERAIEIDPDNPAIIDSIGWLYFLRGQYIASES